MGHGVYHAGDRVRDELPVELRHQQHRHDQPVKSLLFVFIERQSENPIGALIISKGEDWRSSVFSQNDALLRKTNVGDVR